MASPAILAAALAGSLALSATLATMAVAQNVPLPVPAPSRSGAPPAAGQQQQRPSAPVPTTPGAQRDPKGGIAAPVIRPPSIFSPGQTTAFDARQRALVDRVSAYLMSVRVLSG